MMVCVRNCLIPGIILHKLMFRYYTIRFCKYCVLTSTQYSFDNLIFKIYIICFIVHRILESFGRWLHIQADDKVFVYLIMINFFGKKIPSTNKMFSLW